MVEKRQTESITFRIDKQVLDSLRDAAKRQKISPNSLAGQILGSYLEWGAKAVAAGWVSMPKPFLIELMKLIDEKDMTRTIAGLSSEFGKDADLFMRGRHDLEAWLSVIRSRATRSGFNIMEYRRGDELEIVIQHDMGKKWSLYFKTFYENVFYDLGAKARFDYTENTITITLDAAPPKGDLTA
ncbi:MAG: hypothetical protein KGI33_09970 [Thaumarchaeota archaeon]|nr:hypothetical protein [Nitrososphaerota archaeon]